MFPVRLEFTEPVTGLALDAIEVAAGTAAELAGTDRSYTLQVTPRANYAGEVTVTVRAHAATDAEGNGNVAGSAAFRVDTRTPTVTETTLQSPPREWTESTDTGTAGAGGAVQYPDDGAGGSGSRTAQQVQTRYAITVSAVDTNLEEGESATFALTRAVSQAAVTAAVAVTETGSMVGAAPPTEVTFAAGVATATVSVPTTDDGAAEHDSIVQLEVRDVAGAEYAPGDPRWDTVTVLDSDSSPPRSGDLRIREGHSSLDGRVEIYLNGEWGTICGNRFFDAEREAALVCRQLGYSSEASLRPAGNTIATAGAPIWLSSVRCVHISGEPGSWSADTLLRRAADATTERTYGWIVGRR